VTNESIMLSPQYFHPEDAYLKGPAHRLDFTKQTGGNK